MSRIAPALVASVLLYLAAPSFCATLVVDQRNPRAADSGAGSAAAPFKTIGAAVAKVQPGDTILVKGGTYREQVELPAAKAEAPITLAGADAGARPSIRGSDVLKGPWTKAQANVVYRGPEPVSIYSCPFEPYTQMVFVDDQPLKQIGPFEYIGPKDQGTPGWENIVKFDGKDQGDLRPGTFFYDREAKRLYVWLSDGSDPAKHQVECAVRFIAVTLNDYCQAKNLDVRHCQMFPRKGECALVGRGHGILIENCRVVHNDFSGVMIQGWDHIMRGCELAYNGNNGLTSSFGNHMLMEGNSTHHNNTRHYGPGWLDGGMKVHEFKDCRFVRHHAHDEPGSGLWLDISCLNATIADSLFENCAVGLYYEISRWGIIVNNVARDCGMGLWSYSSDVLIANNVVDRCGEGIVVTGDIRGAEYSLGYPEPPDMCLAATRNNMICNNLIIDCPGSFLGIARDTIHSGSHWSDYNAFVWTIPAVHPNTNHVKFMAGFDDYYAKLPTWNLERHLDEHSVIADPALYKLRGQRQIEVAQGVRLLGDPLLVGREKGDYRLQPGSPLRQVGIEVPATLPSLYKPGIHPWVKTLVKDAPGPQRAVAYFEAWGQPHYRYQALPAPRMMFAPETARPAPVGRCEEWTRTGSYPAFSVSDQPEQPVLEVKSAHYDNLVNDPLFAGQTQQGKIVPPWFRAEGGFHSFLWQGIANLADYAPAALGYQFIGVVTPSTRYTLWGLMRTSSTVAEVTTTGRMYLAVGPATPPTGAALTRADLTLVGTPAQAIAAPKVDISWRPYEALFGSGAQGEDKAVGQGLYVVLDGHIAGSGICPNGGNPNGQVAWDNLYAFSEQ